MIDFTKSIKLLGNYTGANTKIKIKYNNKVYMIKFPDRAREKKIELLSYINNVISEYRMYDI